jgi:hypothetical protein
MAAEGRQMNTLLSTPAFEPMIISPPVYYSLVHSLYGLSAREGFMCHPCMCAARVSQRQLENSTLKRLQYSPHVANSSKCTARKHKNAW